jgi:spermidine synthase
MSVNFEELDYRATSMGLLSLRRRKETTTGAVIYEIKLDEDFLMSSFFTVAEIALSNLGLAASSHPAPDVVVGGLGLGYTAVTALEHAKVRELLVIDALPEVIEWHQEGMLPLGKKLMADPRCRLIHGDFFAMAASPRKGFDPDARGRKFHAVLLDVDHSPRAVLHPSHAPFYQSEGLSKLASHLVPGGVFALWSDDPPDEEFEMALGEVFDDQQTHVVTFPNPLQPADSGDDGENSNTVYVAIKA